VGGTKVAVFHPGTQHSWQTARALQELGKLEWFATSIFYQPERWPYVLERLPSPLGPRLHREFRRFSAPALDPALVRTSGIAEWLERLAIRAGFHRVAGWLDATGNRRFGRALARSLRSPAPFALWGYNASSLDAFLVAKREGRLCVLDRTIGDWRSYNLAMDALEDRYGDWFVAGERRQGAAVVERESAEHELADRILVGSEFAAGAVRQFAEGPAIAAKVEVLEYCYDDLLFGALPAPSPMPAGRPVRFLFLGQAIPRKGIHLALEAISRFPPNEAELTIVGALKIPPGVFSPYADRVRYLPTVPRAEVPALMAAHDVLLFPTYFEGAGLVLYEALAAGMALIQSDRASIAVTPETGVLLESLTSDALVAAMHLAVSDRARLNEWRANAQRSARRYTFEGYRNRIAALLEVLAP
jgi:glycosyltransferase involved in cell wall biosynthesis